MSDPERENSRTDGRPVHTWGVCRAVAHVGAAQGYVVAIYCGAMDDEGTPRLYYSEITPERPHAQWKSQSLDELAERFRRAGVPDDPVFWARTEIEEDFAQYSRFVFLKLLWGLVFELQSSCVQAVGELPGGADLVADDAEDLAKALAGPIGLFAHQVLYLLGGDVEAFGHVPEDDEPGWRLMEVIGGQLTGRPVRNLSRGVRQVSSIGL